MGLLLQHKYVPVVQNELNLRFSPGDALTEMVALQKEFDIFSSRHSLASAAALLNVVPPEAKDRRGWFRYLNNLKRIKSDKAKMSGHDRIVTAIRDNLRSRKPMPVFFAWHPQSEDGGVHVTVDTAFVFSSERYVVISAPVALAR